MSSCVSLTGPPTTDFLPRGGNLMRAPFALDWSPAPSSMTPAFNSSSLYLPICASLSSLGSCPASLAAWAFTIIMKRMVRPPSGYRGHRDSSVAQLFGASTDTPNRLTPDRPGLESRSRPDARRTLLRPALAAPPYDPPH